MDKNTIEAMKYHIERFRSEIYSAIGKVKVAGASPEVMKILADLERSKPMVCTSDVLMAEDACRGL